MNRLITHLRSNMVGYLVDLTSDTARPIPRPAPVTNDLARKRPGHALGSAGSVISASSTARIAAGSDRVA